MAKKIQVWATKHQVNQVEEGHQTTLQPMDIDKLPSDYKCFDITLVVHDGARERVFTESEVRALLRDIMNAQTSADIANGYVNAVIGWAEIFRKHNVSIDPA